MKLCKTVDGKKEIHLDLWCLFWKIKGNIIIHKYLKPEYFIDLFSNFQNT